MDKKDIDKLLKEQLDSLENLNRAVSNFSKKGARERKRLGRQCYLDVRKVIDNFNIDFQENHKILIGVLPHDHEYFENDIAKKFTGSYNDGHRTINIKMKEEIPEEHTEPIIPRAESTIAPERINTNAPPANQVEPPVETVEAQPHNISPFMTRVRNIEEQFSRFETDENNFEEDTINYTMRPNLTRLPPIEVKKFKGNEKEWQPFIEIFQSLIHENTRLSRVEKLRYLLSYLEDVPRKLISHMAITSANYESALKILKNRYENKRILVASYIRSIIQYKKFNQGSPYDIINFHDLLNASLAGIENLGYNISSWDPMIVSIICEKFDAETNKAFEESLNDPTETPTIEIIRNFLLKRFRILKSFRPETNNPKPLNRGDYKPKRDFPRNLHINAKNPQQNNVVCSKCRGDHALIKCEEFKKLSVFNRKQHAKDKRICFNCLSHPSSDECKSKKLCMSCNKRHHSLLHFDKDGPALERKSTSNNLHITQENEAENDVVVLHTRNTSVILPTVIINIQGKDKGWHKFRALLDTGSGDSFISEHAAQLLRLQKTKIHVTIKGFGDVKAGQCKALVNLHIASRFQSGVKILTKAFVMPKLTTLLPKYQLNTNYKRTTTAGIELADPHYHKPAPIDLILGAKVYANIIGTNVLRENNGLTAHETAFGWVMMGATSDIIHMEPTIQVTSLITTAEIDELLNKFWELDTYDNEEIEHEQQCEAHFRDTYQILKNGRYQVQIPFKIGTELKLGNSRNQALCRFLSMEKKMRTNENFKEEYTKFMSEYEELGHMEKMPPYNGPPEKSYFLPHHAVFKESSTTTKMRIVFDASAKTSSGVSLNELMHTGPKLQQDLIDILTRWRLYKIVCTADVEKMFRQILIHPRDRNYHRILWRNTPHAPIQEYQLKTVTYGTASATYLSIKTLQQIAIDHGDMAPNAKRVLMEDFYVDDLITGAHSVDDAKKLFSEVKSLMEKGRMHIRKWTSNSKDVLSIIPEDYREKGIFDIKEDETIRPLGIQWSPTKDEFQFTIKFDDERQLTKRVILSQIATIFDPIGWLAPVIIRAKIIMQMLWIEELDWNDKPSNSIIKLWREFRQDLVNLKSLKIPRWTEYTPDAYVEIHGFADASIKAAGACVYLRITHNNTTKVNLLISKSKVAPKKGKISIPRMELCAAVLLAQLMTKTKLALKLSIQKEYTWTDSEITLCWIAKDPSTWHTYVANRVAKIHNNTTRDNWHHVISEQNPADLASRGLSTEKFVNSRLWWRGPSWLRHDPSTWPLNNPSHAQLVEKEIMESTGSLFTLSSISNPFHEWEECFGPKEESWERTLLNKYSSFNKLSRVIAYAMRMKKSSNHTNTTLSVEEITTGKNIAIRLLQRQHFKKEMELLEKNKSIPIKSTLAGLNPFIKDGIMRSRGRTQKAKSSWDRKNPIILPKDQLTKYIIWDMHLELMHAGPNLTQNRLCAEYWLVKGGSYVKKVLKGCMLCAKAKKIAYKQLMGTLPEERVTAASPFVKTGVDYAGPILTKRNKGRGNTLEKAYVSVFVCFVTKAVHLEAVTDLTARTFLAAFDRFINRRGKPSLMMSDNGTNFVAAKRILDKELQQAIKAAQAKANRFTSKEVQEAARNGEESAAAQTALKGIEWKFIPPGTPHFGGLWEAAVKSMKKHFLKIIGDERLTFEELCTVLTKIEAILNSRPLTPLSADSNDLEALTPGHFLIGRPLTDPPQEECGETNLNKRWTIVSQMQQEFWRRWSDEYLRILHQRTKWKQEGTSPAIGELVLLRDEPRPVLTWPLARIIDVKPDHDGIVRVVTLKLSGQRTRTAAIHNLIQLPAYQGESQQNQEFNNTTPQQNQLNSAQELNDDVMQQQPPEDSIISQPIPESSAPISTEPVPSTSQGIGRAVTRSMTRNILLTLLHLWLLMSTVFASNYTITRPPAGMYIEGLGEVQLTRGKLRIELPLSLEVTQNDTRNSLNVMKQSKELCKQSQDLAQDSHCESLIHHLQHEQYILQERINDIIERVPTHNRTKRNIIGKIMSFVLGDDESYTHLDTILRNRNTLVQTMNQQTLMLNTQIRQSNEITAQKLKIFDDRIVTLSKTITDMQHWTVRVNRNSLELKMLTAYLAAADYIQELNERYELIQNTLQSSSFGIQLFGQKQLEEKFIDAHQKIGAELSISKKPLDKVDLICDEKGFLIRIYFEILETRPYDLIHITSIPKTSANNLYMIQDIQQSYIGLNYHQQAYFFMSESELKDCRQLNSGLRSCGVNIIYDIEHNPSCIINQVVNKNAAERCPFQKILVEGIIWKKLSTQDTWFFITKNTTMAAIICSGFREEATLTTYGILHSNPDCYIKANAFTLRAGSIQGLKATGAFSRPIEYPSFNATEINDHSPVKIEMTNVIKGPEAIYPSASVPITKIITLESYPEHSTTYTLSGIICTIIITVILWKTHACWWPPIRSFTCTRAIAPKKTTDESTTGEHQEPTFTERLRRLQLEELATDNNNSGAQYVQEEHVF